jgi:hypothetical protein
MDARKVAAKFAAYAWYEESRASSSRNEAARFAKQNWSAFLPVADQGWGRLLIRIATHREKSRRLKAHARSRKPVLA